MRCKEQLTHTEHFNISQQPTNVEFERVLFFLVCVPEVMDYMIKQTVVLHSHSKHPSLSLLSDYTKNIICWYNISPKSHEYVIFYHLFSSVLLFIGRILFEKLWGSK